MKEMPCAFILEPAPDYGDIPKEVSEMSLSTGLQLFSVKNALARDYVGTLEQVAKIGYKNLELAMRTTDDGLSLGGDISYQSAF